MNPASVKVEDSKKKQMREKMYDEPFVPVLNIGSAGRRGMAALAPVSSTPPDVALTGPINFETGLKVRDSDSGLNPDVGLIS